jgi:hypothetical protein
MDRIETELDYVKWIEQAAQSTMEDYCEEGGHPSCPVIGKSLNGFTTVVHRTM